MEYPTTGEVSPPLLPPTPAARVGVHHEVLLGARWWPVLGTATDRLADGRWVRLQFPAPVGQRTYSPDALLTVRALTRQQWSHPALRDAAGPMTQETSLLDRLVDAWQRWRGET